MCSRKTYIRPCSRIFLRRAQEYSSSRSSASGSPNHSRHSRLRACESPRIWFITPGGSQLRRSSLAGLLVPPRPLPAAGKAGPAPALRAIHSGGGGLSGPAAKPATRFAALRAAPATLKFFGASLRNFWPRNGKQRPAKLLPPPVQPTSTSGYSPASCICLIASCPVTV